MWVFLATEIMFFGGLFFAYLYGRAHWPEGFAIASRRTDVCSARSTPRCCSRAASRWRSRSRRPSTAGAAGRAAALADRGARRRLPRHQGHRVPARVARATWSRAQDFALAATAGRRALLLPLFPHDRRARRAPDDRHRPDGGVRRAAPSTRAAGRTRRGCRSRGSTGTSSTWSGSSSIRSSTSSSATREHDRRQRHGRLRRRRAAAWRRRGSRLVVLMLASLGSAYLKLGVGNVRRRARDRDGQDGARRLGLHAAAPRFGDDADRRGRRSRDLAAAHGAQLTSTTARARRHRLRGNRRSRSRRRSASIGRR